MTTYDTLAMRTLSPGFDKDAFDEDDLRNLFIDAKAVGSKADEIKRALFYTEKTDTLDHAIPADVFHGVLGVISEMGELVEWLENGINSGKLDPQNLMEELGDSGWYHALLRTWGGFTREEQEEININKLRVRYPNKFTRDDAIDRPRVMQELDSANLMIDTPPPPFQSRLEDHSFMKRMGLNEMEIAEVEQLMKLDEREWPKVIKDYILVEREKFPGADKLVSLSRAVKANSNL